MQYKRDYKRHCILSRRYNLLVAGYLKLDGIAIIVSSQVEDGTWKEHAKKHANRQKYEKREYLLVQNAMLGKYYLWCNHSSSLNSAIQYLHEDNLLTKVYTRCSYLARFWLIGKKCCVNVVSL